MSFFFSLSSLKNNSREERAGASNCREERNRYLWKFREFTTLVPSYGHKETTARRGASDSVQGPFHLIQQFFLVLLRQGFPWHSAHRVWAQLGGGGAREGGRKKGAPYPLRSNKRRTLKKHDGAAELPVSHGERVSLSP